MVLFDRSGHFGRSDRNVPFHLAKLLSPVPLFCILVYKNNNQTRGALEPGLCNRNVPFHWACESVKPEFLLNGKRPEREPNNVCGQLFWLFDICWNMQLIKLLPLHATCSTHPYKIQPYFMRFIACFWKLLLTCFVLQGEKCIVAAGFPVSFVLPPLEVMWLCFLVAFDTFQRVFAAWAFTRSNDQNWSVSTHWRLYCLEHCLRVLSRFKIVAVLAVLEIKVRKQEWISSLHVC